MKVALLGCMLLALLGCESELSNKRPDQQGNTVVGQSLARAKDKKCMDNLRQCRLAVEVQRTSGDDALPETLNDFRLPQDTIICPNDKKPYTYDPSTGTIECEHEGHEKY